MAASGAEARGLAAGRAGCGSVPGKSADGGVPSPALVERSGRPPPSLQEEPSAPPPSLPCALGSLSPRAAAGAAGPPSPGRAGRGRAVSEAGGGRGCEGAGGRGECGEQRRAGGWRGSQPRRPFRAAGPRRSVCCGRHLLRQPSRAQLGARQPSTRCSAGALTVL